MNTKKFYWLAQFIGWFAYCGLLALSVYSDDPARIDDKFLLNILFLIVTGIIATHIQRIVFIRLGWLGIRLPRLIPRLIFSSFICSIFISSVFILTDYITDVGEVKNEGFQISDFIVNVFAILVLVLFWNAIYFTFHFFQQSRRQEVSNLELKASNRESELKNLRSQLNPHFLFNSLNSIRALVDMDPIKAKVSITTLSNLLRQSLVLGNSHLVTLENELSLAKNYLDLEKIRFEERLKVVWDLTPGLENFEIPPFTLQMMVENAIKHGISQLKDGGVVTISAHENVKNVIIEVSNSGNLNGVVDLGVGIKNIKQRLALQYEQGAEFSIFENDGVVIAKMEFKK